jgi:hypothetical protein
MQKHASAITINYCVRFKILMVASMKMTAFWNMTPCSTAEVDLHFRGVYGRHHCPNDGGSMQL